MRRQNCIGRNCTKPAYPSHERIIPGNKICASTASNNRRYRESNIVCYLQRRKSNAWLDTPTKVEIQPTCCADRQRCACPLFSAVGYHDSQNAGHIINGYSAACTGTTCYS